MNLKDRLCPLPANMRWNGDTIRASVRLHHGPGGKPSETFHPDARGNFDLKAIEHWIEDQRVAFRQANGKPAAAAHAPAPAEAPKPVAQPLFRDDARRYLGLVKAMPSYKIRVLEIERWIAEFGDRPRASITHLDIAEVLERWRTDPGARQGHSRTGTARSGLAPGSLNKRRTALQHLYSRLDGKRAAAQNPVRDVPRYDEPKPQYHRRAQDPMVWDALLSHMRTTSKTRARLEVILKTALPHQLVRELADVDFDEPRGLLRVPRREKGKKVEGQWLPLLPEGLAAMRRFRALNCWGTFEASGLWRCLDIAWRKENALREAKGLAPLTPMHPYDGRHTACTEMCKRTKDLRGLLMLTHLKTLKTLQHYTGSVDQQIAERCRDEIAANLAGAKKTKKPHAA